MMFAKKGGRFEELMDGRRVGIRSGYRHYWGSMHLRKSFHKLSEGMVVKLNQ
jgi:hypothetical protein